MEHRHLFQQDSYQAELPLALLQEKLDLSGQVNALLLAGDGGDTGLGQERYGSGAAEILEANERDDPVGERATLQEAARLYREGGWPAEVEGREIPWSALGLGAALLVGVLDVVGTIASGWFTDRFEPRRLLAV